MRIIGPQGPVDHSTSQYHRPASARSRATTFVVAVWVGFVALALPTFSVIETIVAALSPIYGLAVGAWAGLGLGFGIVAHAPSAPLILPVLSAAMLGAAAGFLSAWLARAWLDENDGVGRSFISSLFSPDLLQRNPAGFVCYLIVATAIGFALSTALSSVGTFDPATEIGRNWLVILGGGPGGPFGDNLISFLVALFKMLGALLVACGIAGLCIGGVLGGAIGAGFSTIGVSAVVGGASEGLAYRFFEPYRPEKLRSGRLTYLLVGAGFGAGEGVLVGFGTGAVLFILQIAAIFG